ncbi:hypothetical protein J1N35_024164 [Gossypium stocksii]|uniref:Uncharacterized protein n=1 Tax=Gossypium stocksii TaxID=47602 RepID=A0A9D3VJV2_9ROSI|nr:hypothetical protein J1N35_024164 [Gossypium stocksii]
MPFLKQIVLALSTAFCFHKEDITILGHHIKEACKMLDSFVSAEVKWVKRCCDKLTNSLCNWALSKCCNLSFEMDCLSDIHNIVISDVN